MIPFFAVASPCGAFYDWQYIYLERDKGHGGIGIIT